MAKSTGQLGASAEEVAVSALIAAGYQIIERNFTCAAGELDVIARHRGVLVFVEVRSRANDRHGSAAEMVTPAKQRRVTRVARVYLAAKRPAYTRCRFDVVAITGDRVDLIPDAWRVSGPT